MRRSAMTRRAVVQTGTMASGVFLFPAISGAAAQDAAEITFWNSTLPVEDPNDLTKPLEDFYVFQAIERFQEANPDISVTLETLPGGPGPVHQVPDGQRRPEWTRRDGDVVRHLHAAVQGLPGTGWLLLHG